MGEKMILRYRSSRMQTTFAASLLLGLWGLILPAAAQTAGERALLNNVDAGVAIKAQVPNRAVRSRSIDGPQALLNQPSAGEAVAVQTTAAGRSTPVAAESVDGRRALLGTLEAGAPRASSALSRR